MKRDNFCDFLLTNLYPNKCTGTSTGKEFAPRRVKFSMKRKHTDKAGKYENCTAASLNPLYTGRLFHCYMLDQSIGTIMSVGSILLL